MKETENNQKGSFSEKNFSILGIIIFLGIFLGNYVIEWVRLDTLSLLTRQKDKPYAVRLCRQAEKLTSNYNKQTAIFNEAININNEIANSSDDEELDLLAMTDKALKKFHEVKFFNTPVDEMTQDQLDYLYGLLVICDEAEEEGGFDSVKDVGEIILRLKLMKDNFSDMQEMMQNLEKLSHSFDDIDLD